MGCTIKEKRCRSSLLCKQRLWQGIPTLFDGVKGGFKPPELFTVADATELCKPLPRAWYELFIDNGGNTFEVKGIFSEYSVDQAI